MIAVFAYAANTFPTTLNDWEDGDIIESDWADSIEAAIGVTNSAVTTSLNYRIANHASLSLDETITGNWVNTANPWADNEVVDTLTLSGGTIGSNTLSSGATFTGSASLSVHFEVSGFASASKYFGNALSLALDCNDATDKFLYDFGTGLFSCGTIVDADVPDTITLTGGTIGANSISGTQTTTGTLTFGDNGDAINFDTSTWDISAGVLTGLTISTNNVTGTWTTTGNLTIGDNGDDVIIDSDTWNVSSLGAFTGVTGITSTGTIDFGGATTEIANGTGPTFSAVGQIYYDSTLEFFKIATQSEGPGAVIPAKQILWSRTIASSAMDFVNGGRIPFPSKPSGWKYIIVGIVCDVDSGTSAVINVSNMDGTKDTETVTCDIDGQEDTSIDTNWNYTSFTKPSSSLEFGALTGSPDYVNVTVYGYYSE